MFRGVCILAIVALAAYAQESGSQPPYRIDIVTEKCKQELNYTEQPNHNFTESLINNPKTRCYVACLWRNMGAVNEDNTFNLTRWAEASPHHKRDPVRDQFVRECLGEIPANPDLCEVAYNLHMCLARKQKN